MFVTSIVPTSTASAGYSDKSLTPGTAYAYTVAPYDVAGNMLTPSTSTSATTQSALPPVCDQTIRNVPADYPSIQAAIDAASAGDTIKVAAGTYTENVKLRSGICLEGAGIDQTIISHNGASGITGKGVSYVIVKNLTVGGSGCEPGPCGGGGDGGGISLSESSNITLQSCRLTGNAALNGGGMFISRSSVAMDHCLIDNNTARNMGGGLMVDADSNVSLANVTVTSNSWSNALGNGGVGGVRAYGSSMKITDSILWGNTDQNFSGNGSGVNNSDVGGFSGGANNIDHDPGFVSATDYHAQASSPTADMGLY